MGFFKSCVLSFARVLGDLALEFKPTAELKTWHREMFVEWMKSHLLYWKLINVLSGSLTCMPLICKSNTPYKWKILDYTVFYYTLSQISPSHNRSTVSCIKTWRPPGYHLGQQDCWWNFRSHRFWKSLTHSQGGGWALGKPSSLDPLSCGHRLRMGVGWERNNYFSPTPAAAGRSLLQRITFLLFTGCGRFCCVVLLFSPGVISVAHGARTMQTTLSSMRRVLCQDTVVPHWAQVPF